MIRPHTGYDSEKRNAENVTQIALSCPERVILKVAHKHIQTSFAVAIVCDLISYCR